MKKKSNRTILVVGGLHIRRLPDGTRHLNIDQTYYWRVNKWTKKKEFLKPGTIAKVVARKTVVKVVVVSIQEVSGPLAIKRALSLKAVVGFSKKTLSDFGLTTEFNHYLQKRQGLVQKNNKEEYVSFSELSKELGKSNAYISSLKRTKPEAFRGIEIKQMGHSKKIRRDQANLLKKRIQKNE